MKENTIGVDISKAKLDVYRLSDGEFARFDNDTAGFGKLKRWIGGKPPQRIVYEATGPYHTAFERACAGRLPLVRVNPLNARRFVQSFGTRAKTDRADAAMLARMGHLHELQPDQPRSEEYHELKELQAARNGLVNDRTRLLNREKTQTVTLLKRLTLDRIAQVQRQIAKIEAEIKARLKATPETARAHQIVTSIPGIADVSAAALLIECPEIGKLGRKQIANLAGLAPMTRESGQWKGKAFIQGGRHHLRRALYMPALVARKHNPELKEKYEKMIANGKPPKVALTAIMRKLIELANALIRDDREWTLKCP